MQDKGLCEGVINEELRKPLAEPKVDSMAGSVSFSIEEIKHYLTGLCLVGEHKENDMLNCAISLLEDYEDGIEAVLERRKQNSEAHGRRSRTVQPLVGHSESGAE